MSVRDIIQAAAGVGGEAGTYIEDVFSTYLYTGNGSTQTITNGIDLAGEGGLVWTKCRVTASISHALIDTERGGTSMLRSNSTAVPVSSSGYITSFNSNGWTMGGNTETNLADEFIVSWTFRKAPKFFDIVAYTGNGAARSISHNLGSTPGCIIVKNLSRSVYWTVWHRSATGDLKLNDTAAQESTYYYISGATDTTFSIPSGGYTPSNQSGDEYIAYLFAHDAGGFGDSGEENVISCGGYTGNGSTGQLINLGFEPQWVLIKQRNGVDQWAIIDNMRNWAKSDSATLCANTANQENADFSASGATSLEPQGFRLWNANSAINESGGTYIYIAIRRGPMKTPESGTEVFDPNYADTWSGTYNIGFPFDLQIARPTGFAANWTWSDRLRQISTTADFFAAPALYSNSTSTETTATGQINKAVDNKGYSIPGAYSSQLSIYYSLRRAPGFFDTVCYTGNGPGTQVISHNLAAVPELVINKTRSNSNGWTVFQGSTTTLSGFLRLNETSAQGGDSLTVSSTSFTADSTIGFGMNTNGYTYVTYLFATVAGVSKVGRYTGTGTTQQINCGFSSGARFVLIKRYDSTGDWYVFDSARGITSLTDPFIWLNSTSGQDSNFDYIDPYSAGFEISSTAPAAINANGGTFIFLAIA